jgi:Flp pilus assembly pilin Flp
MVATFKEVLEQTVKAAGNEEGQALAEYGLLLTLIAVACILAVTALGLAIAGQLDSITGAL